MTSTNTTSLRHYEYEPLSSPDTVRVLRLEPAESRSKPLRGSLVQLKRYENLAKTDDYQWFSAVSYTWGAPDFSQRLLLKGSLGLQDEYLSITENVKIMLQYLRKPHKPQYLWIDAICLNQKDDAEKSQQIPLMGEIYLHARKVYIWLGRDNGNDATRIFAYFRILALAPHSELHHNVFSSGREGLAQLNRFFRREWFFRRWTLQEAAFARNGVVCCGRSKIPYEAFVSACRLLGESVDIQDKDALQTMVKISDTIKLRDGPENPEYLRDIYALLWKFHTNSCSEKRDRIAALYGFLPRTLQLRVDSAASYRDIYWQHAVALGCTSSQHLLILHLFHFGPIRCQEGSGVPSWVPDWSNERRINIACFYDPYEDKLDLKTPEAIDVFFDAIRLLQDQTAMTPGLSLLYEVISRGKWPTHIRYRSRLLDTFNENRLLLNFERGLRAPNTIFLTCDDDDNRDFLTVSWINPWAGPYGRPITAVVAITEDLRVANDPSDYRSIFEPFTKNIYSHRGEDNLERLCLLIDSIVTVPASLDQQRQIVLKYAMCEFFRKKPSKNLHAYASLRLKLSSLAQPEDIVAQLVRALHQSDLAIVELEAGRGECDYALGPSTLQLDMRLIPLASRYADHEALDEARYFHPAPRIAWFEKKTNDSAMTNFIAVKPETEKVQPDISSRSKEKKAKRGETKLDRKDGRELDYVPRIKATYVGPCMGVVAYDAMHFLRYSSSQSGYQEVETHLMGYSFFHAQREGRPPPYMMDIY